ncbi:hypothetical protein DRO49_01870 [Candidatus Bathyarchaeota archaeon]|nr:MAG: hypothetical protein DRO49_01870 [Candidatus Bathyarchaeota archaeon]
MKLPIPPEVDVWVTHYDCYYAEIVFHSDEEDWEIQAGLDPVLRILTDKLGERIEVPVSSEEFETSKGEFQFSNYTQGLELGEYVELQEEEEYDPTMHWIQSLTDCSVSIGLLTEPKASARLLVGKTIRDETESNSIAIEIDSVPESNQGIAQWWITLDYPGSKEVLGETFIWSGLKTKFWLKMGEEILEPGEEFSFECEGQFDQDGIYVCNEPELELVMQIKNEHSSEVEDFSVKLFENPILIAHGKKEDGGERAVVLIPEEQDLQKAIGDLIPEGVSFATWQVKVGIIAPQEELSNPSLTLEGPKLGVINPYSKKLPPSKYKVQPAPGGADEGGDGQGESDGECNPNDPDPTDPDCPPSPPSGRMGRGSGPGGNDQGPIGGAKLHGATFVFGIPPIKIKVETVDEEKCESVTERIDEDGDGKFDKEIEKEYCERSSKTYIGIEIDNPVQSIIEAIGNLIEKINEKNQDEEEEEGDGSNQGSGGDSSGGGG